MTTTLPAMARRIVGGAVKIATVPAGRQLHQRGFATEQRGEFM